jgi:hypothetical protein
VHRTTTPWGRQVELPPVTWQTAPKAGSWPGAGDLIHLSQRDCTKRRGTTFPGGTIGLAHARGRSDARWRRSVVRSGREATRGSMASLCCTPTPTSTHATPCCATSNCGARSRPSGLPGTSFRRGRPSTSGMRQSAGRCLAGSSHWYRPRSQSMISTHQARRPTIAMW